MLQKYLLLPIVCQYSLSHIVKLVKQNFQKYQSKKINVYDQNDLFPMLQTDITFFLPFYNFSLFIYSKSLI